MWLGLYSYSAASLRKQALSRGRFCFASVRSRDRERLSRISLAVALSQVSRPSFSGASWRCRKCTGKLPACSSWSLFSFPPSASLALGHDRSRARVVSHPVTLCCLPGRRNPDSCARIPPFSHCALLLPANIRLAVCPSETTWGAPTSSPWLCVCRRSFVRALCLPREVTLNLEFVRNLRGLRSRVTGLLLQLQVRRRRARGAHLAAGAWQ